MYGLEDIGKLIVSVDKDSPLKMQMLAVRLKSILEGACRKRGFNINFHDCVHVECSPRGIVINTTTASLANRLKQIRPTLDKALFDHGIHLPIEAIRSGKIQTLPNLDPYPQDPPRIAPAGASDAVYANALKAQDPDVKKALEQLAQALAH